MADSDKLTSQIDLIDFFKLIADNYIKIIFYTFISYIISIFISIAFFDKYSTVFYRFDRSSFSEKITHDLKILNSHFHDLNKLSYIKEVFVFQNKNYKNFSKEEMAEVVILTGNNDGLSFLSPDGTQTNTGTRFLPQSIISMVSMHLNIDDIAQRAYKIVLDEINNKELLIPSVQWETDVSTDPFDKYEGISNYLDIIIRFPNDFSLNKNSHLDYLSSFFLAYTEELRQSITKEIMLMFKLGIEGYDDRKRIIIDKLNIQNNYYITKHNETLNNKIAELEADAEIAIMLQNDGFDTVTDGKIVDLSNSRYLRGYIPLQNEIDDLKKNFGNSSLVPGFVMNTKIIEQLKDDIFIEDLKIFLKNTGIDSGNFNPFVVNKSNVALSSVTRNPFLNILSILVTIGGCLFSIFIISAMKFIREKN